jgi:hypothetical protein
VPVPDSSSSASDATRDTAGSRRFTRRRFLAGSAAIPLTVLLGDRLEALAAPAARRYGPQGACGLPDYVLKRIWRGYRRGTSGQIVVVPSGRNFLGAGAPHAGPWPYTQNVPMFWYGPGVVKPTPSIARQVTSADIAPTLARLVGFDGFEAPDGKDMFELRLEPDADLKLIVVLVWDAGGRFVLDLWPKDWPNLRRMKAAGAWFDRASVGSSPSNTAPIHATIGTGAFPRHHGIIDNVMKFPDGQIRSSWADGPTALEVPGFAELYQQAYGDEVMIGMAGSVSWHLGMVGHGNIDPDGAKPVVILKNDRDGGEGAPPWEMPASVDGYYRFADYVRDLPPISNYFGYANQIDGNPGDGLWRGKDIDSLEGGWATPARIPYQSRAIKELVVREHFGKHDRTDLLFLNYKVIDEIGHRYYASSLEMSDSLRAQDHFLEDFVQFLDRKVGKKKWAMLLTADHGHTAKPGQGGGYLINQHAVQDAIEGLRHNQADPLLITQLRPMWLNIDDDALHTAGKTYMDVSKLVAELTREETRSLGEDLTDPHAPVFDAVFAGSLLDRLDCWSPPAVELG